MSRVEMIPISGCWLWTGKLSGAGYGELRIDDGGRDAPVVLAHRFSYEQFVGPLGDLQACHECDVPCCVNPAHLFAGTPADNCHDKMNKGRGNRGFIGRPYRKLSPEQHESIRLSDESSKVLANRFGVHYTHINWIKRK